MVRSLFITATLSLILTSLALSIWTVGFAQVRSSTNYQLQSDSVNIGGGLSSSTSYVQESTVGEIATGPSDSTSYSLRAGYQQMQEVFLSLTPPNNVIMDTPIDGIGGGTSNGSTSFNVVTDSPSGYQVIISAEADPAMVRTGGSEIIGDYPADTTPDFSFTFGSADAFFGMTAEGADISAAFRDNGALCNVGSGDTVNACWRGLNDQNNIIVAQNTNANIPSGATTTLKFRVGIGSTAGVIAGTYVATTTITALPL